MARVHKNKGARAARREERRERIAQGSELPASDTALHESAHAFMHVLLDTPDFICVDLKRRTHKTNPDTVPRGFTSLGMNTIITPKALSLEYAYKRVFASWAPIVVAESLGYNDEDIKGDLREIGILGGKAFGLKDGSAVGTEWADRTRRLTKEILSDPAVLAGVMNVAIALDRDRELTADKVREIIAMHPVRPLPAEVQELISTPLLD